VTNIEDIEGIGPAFAEKLRAAGISSVEELLGAGKTPAMRQALAEKTGLSGDSILTWVNHADLFRINGVAGEFAELLEASGVDSVPELAQRVAANLQGRMTEVNAQKSLTRRVPSVEMLEGWIKEAKTMPRMVEH
jgi:predicted flap endonuclease-1-like 5' DNA nuclease